MNINECQIHRAINSVRLILLLSEGIKRYARYCCSNIFFFGPFPEMYILICLTSAQEDGLFLV